MHVQLSRRFPRSVGHRRWVALLALVSAGAAGAASAAPQANLALNGDFESITGSGCQYNLSNSTYGSVVSSSTAFGTAQEIDVMSGACYGAIAVSGATKLGLHSAIGGTRDEISLDLSTPLVPGGLYTLSYWVLAETSFDPNLGSLEVGVSNSPTDFGTLVHTGATQPGGVWTQHTHPFVAPFAATYLTLSSGPVVQSWVHVDDVRVETACSANSYCTSGTSAFGCVGTMSSTGVPSVAAPSGFTIRCDGLDGQRSSILFYGVNGAVSQPWAAGSSSYLCVRAPVQRTSIQNTGGTFGACDGSSALDFLAWLAANPAALGQPIHVGQEFHVQCWYRDPPAPKSTSLSDGLHVVMCP